MPYIAPEERERLNPLIDRLAHQIVAESKRHEEEGAFAGPLNYACTRLALRVIELRFGRMRYWLLALVTGTFRSVADEIYRRLGGPYEDRQKERHGDVDLFKTLLDRMHPSS